jgi:hypothetical protein
VAEDRTRDHGLGLTPKRVYSSALIGLLCHQATYRRIISTYPTTVALMMKSGLLRRLAVAFTPAEDPQVWGKSRDCRQTAWSTGGFHPRGHATAIEAYQFGPIRNDAHRGGACSPFSVT